MQNSTARRFANLSNQVATIYQEFFGELPLIDGQVVYPQMPEFQLTYFLDQAVARHYRVQLQFKAAPNVAPMTVSGFLQTDAAHCSAHDSTVYVPNNHRHPDEAPFGATRPPSLI
ncbi:hypothetical protein [Levilactobacillus namurensis]|uniref:hypothetical protein n=1 Tax=Levilactobacillus namurensis TaxID=380393 RepID=UPI00222EF221|nr:hypothetical protein [Levilactobacillus namurensis]MCW3777592.1 hypothetical protein [Levilactobacillus namurensis]MDT7018792.1 hypothetical protein [Levilactobacillus namurensis]WNN66588.1 hypothetical protein RIN67_05810 [Levilactobacillus namurensis]